MIGNLGTPPPRGYDMIVKTQAQFEAMVSSADWLGASSVAIIGEFTWNSGQITVPENVKRIDGYDGAKLTVNNIIGTAEANEVAIRYATTANHNDYSISNLTVEAHSRGSAVAFRDCTNLFNCEAIIYSYGQGSNGFNNCHGLIDCRCSKFQMFSGASLMIIGYYACDDMVNCSCVMNIGNIFGGEIFCHGFAKCSRITNAQVYIMGSYYDTANISTGISDSAMLDNCVVDLNVNNSVRGIHNCKFVSNCIVNVTGSVGYAINDSSHVSNCTYGTLPKTSFLGGVNTYVDTDSVFSANDHQGTSS